MQNGERKRKSLDRFQFEFVSDSTEWVLLRKVHYCVTIDGFFNHAQ